MHAQTQVTYVGGMSLEDLREFADIAAQYPERLPEGMAAELGLKYRRTAGAVGQIISQMRRLRTVGRPSNSDSSLNRLTAAETAFILRHPTPLSDAEADEPTPETESPAADSLLTDILAELRGLRAAFERAWCAPGASE